MRVNDVKSLQKELGGGVIRWDLIKIMGGDDEEWFSRYDMMFL